MSNTTIANLMKAVTELANRRTEARSDDRANLRMGDDDRPFGAILSELAQSAQDSRPREARPAPRDTRPEPGEASQQPTPRAEDLPARARAEDSRARRDEPRSPSRRGEARPEDQREDSRAVRRPFDAPQDDIEQATDREAMLDRPDGRPAAEDSPAAEDTRCGTTDEKPAVPAPAAESATETAEAVPAEETAANAAEATDQGEQAMIATATTGPTEDAMAMPVPGTTNGAAAPAATTPAGMTEAAVTTIAAAAGNKTTLATSGPEGAAGAAVATEPGETLASQPAAMPSAAEEALPTNASAKLAEALKGMDGKAVEGKTADGKMAVAQGGEGQSGAAEAAGKSTEGKGHQLAHPVRTMPFADILGSQSAIYRPGDVLAGLERNLGAGGMASQASGPASRPTPLQMLPIEIGMQAVRGVTNFQIRLDPAELGRVDVKLEIREDGEVNASLVVDRVETLQLLRRDASTLQQAFEQAGLKQGADGLSFSLRGEGQQGQNQEQGHQGRSRNGREEVGLQPQMGEVVMRRALISTSSLDLTI